MAHYRLLLKSPQLHVVIVSVLLPFISGLEINEFSKKLNEDFHSDENRVRKSNEKEKSRETKSIRETNDRMAIFDGHIFSRNTTETAELQTRTSQELKKKRYADIIKPISVNPCLLRKWKRKFTSYCTLPYQGPPCDVSAPYRTANGFCNNLMNPTWGGAETQELREIPPMYDDGISAPRSTGRDGSKLPSARAVSNEVFRVYGESPRDAKLTVMVMQWGQLLDHDVVATPTIKKADGTGINCCEEGAPDMSTCFPIMVPSYDPYFKNQDCLNVVRSSPATETCAPGFREHRNILTSYIDGSLLYGSSQELTLSLRAMQGGLLKTSPGDLLPPSSGGGCKILDSGDFCQLAGDHRVNVVPALGASHTVFMRYHNRVAMELASRNQQWDDETLFQETRKIVAAVIQHINYKEYLGVILNDDTRTKYDLNLSESYNNTYDPKINAGISNAFGAAAFRFGHSQIPDYQAMMKDDGTFQFKTPIENTYRTPHMIQNPANSTINSVCKWLATDPSPQADGLFESGTRNKLFLDDKGNSLDLPAVNIQRGREHGIPAYNYWRIHCGLGKALMSQEGMFLLPDHSRQQAIKLMRVYKHVDDIDLFAGAMTERHLPDSAVGPTFACMLGTEFQKLKNGDRFWYESDNPVVRFTPDQLAAIKTMSLAKVICEPGKSIQPNVFVLPGPSNEIVPCSDIGSLDLSAWQV